MPLFLSVATCKIGLMSCPFYLLQARKEKHKKFDAGILCGLYFPSVCFLIALSKEATDFWGESILLLLTEAGLIPLIVIVRH